MVQKDILGVSWIELTYGTEGRWREKEGGERQMAGMTAQRRGRLRNQEQGAKSKHIDLPAARSPDFVKSLSAFHAEHISASTPYFPGAYRFSVGNNLTPRVENCVHPSIHSFT